MTMNDKDFEKQAKTAFDESVDGLDAATLSRLNRSRQEALAQSVRPGLSGIWRSRWMPATGLAAAALLAVVTLQRPAELDVIAAPASDLEILLSEESIDMLEDLEFYSWLATQDLSGDVG
jgi:hypothetical protein